MSRTPLAAFTGLLAAVLLPLSILSIWVDGVVSDTDTYVETVTPLADDDVVKAAAVEELRREALQLVAATGVTLPPGGEKLVHLAVRRVVDGPAFRTAWEQANRTAHTQLVAVLEGRSNVVLDRDGRVFIELGTVLSTIAQSLADLGLVDPDRLPELHASFAVMDGDQLAKARRAYDVLDTLGFWLPVGWLVAVALTLLLARRRLASTANLAAASVVALGVLALALVFVRDAVTEDLPQRDVALAVWDVVVASLWRELQICGAVAAVVALIAWLVCRFRKPSGADPDGAVTDG